MFVFAVIANSTRPALAQKIAEVYASANFQFSETVWLVADTGVTPQEVCAKLDVRLGEDGISGVLVVRVAGYFGVAPGSTWEWLKVKTGEV
jgi:hypothetical protein